MCIAIVGYEYYPDGIATYVHCIHKTKDSQWIFCKIFTMLQKMFIFFIRSRVGMECPDREKYWVDLWKTL